MYYHANQIAQQLFYDDATEQWERDHGDDAEITEEEGDELWDSWDSAATSVRDKYEKEAE